MSGGDGKCSGLGHIASQIGASFNEEEAKIGRAEVQSDAKVTEGRDYMTFLVVVFCGGDGEVGCEVLGY